MSTNGQRSARSRSTRRELERRRLLRQVTETLEAATEVPVSVVPTYVRPPGLRRRPPPPRRRSRRRRSSENRYSVRLLVDNKKDRIMRAAFLVVHGCTCTNRRINGPNGIAPIELTHRLSPGVRMPAMSQGCSGASR